MGEDIIIAGWLPAMIIGFLVVLFFDSEWFHRAKVRP